jgi:hypothetical protein
MPANPICIIPGRAGAAGKGHGYERAKHKGGQVFHREFHYHNGGSQNDDAEQK